MGQARLSVDALSEPLDSIFVLKLSQGNVAQGCKVYVRSPWGNATVDGYGENLQQLAERTLERLVRADDQKRADWKAYQERETAKLLKPHRRRRPSDDGPQA